MPLAQDYMGDLSQEIPRKTSKFREQRRVVLASGPVYYRGLPIKYRLRDEAPCGDAPIIKGSRETPRVDIAIKSPSTCP